MTKLSSKVEKSCEVCSKIFLIPPSWVTLRKTCSRKCSGVARGKLQSGENNCNYKKVFSPETLKKMSDAKKGIPSWNKGIKTGHTPWNKGIEWLELRGENHPNWTGGRPSCKRCSKMLGNYHPKTGICMECKGKNSIDRHGSRAKEWALAVKKRDNFTCQSCFTRGGVLNSDHIKPWAYYPELRFDLDNGRTLCFDCHAKTATYGGRKYLNPEVRYV